MLLAEEDLSKYLSSYSERLSVCGGCCCRATCVPAAAAGGVGVVSVAALTSEALPMLCAAANGGNPWLAYGMQNPLLW